MTPDEKRTHADWLQREYGLSDAQRGVLLGKMSKVAMETVARQMSTWGVVRPPAAPMDAQSAIDEAERIVARHQARRTR